MWLKNNVNNMNNMNKNQLNRIESLINSGVALILATTVETSWIAGIFLFSGAVNMVRYIYFSSK